MIDIVLQVLPQVFTLEVMGYLLMGLAIGNIFSAIPGLQGILAVALILPFTYFMTPISAIAVLLGMYKGTMFGGAVTAIVFGIPGDSQNAATVLDGYPMCKQGYAKKAMGGALYGSVLGNCFADIMVIVTLIPISLFALMFGPRELTGVMFLAIASIVLLFGGSAKRGLLGVAIGGFIATMGKDSLTAIPRLNFGMSSMMDGIDLVAFVSGLFAFSELLIQFGVGVHLSRVAKQEGAEVDMMRESKPDDKFTFKDLLSVWREFGIGCAVGSALGVLPGPGATMASFTSYGLSGRLKKNKGKMGTGILGGVVAAETASSTTVGPTLIPLLTFGIPSSGIAALFGAALMLQGVTPGPGLFTDHMDLIAAIFIIMIVGTWMNWAMSKWLVIPLFAKIALVERRFLCAVLLPMMALGIYSINLSGFDVFVMVAAGVLGVLLRFLQIPIAPVAVAFIITPLLEMQFKRSIILAQGDWTYFFSSPLSLSLCGIFLGFLIFAWKTR